MSVFAQKLRKSCKLIMRAGHVDAGKSTLMGRLLFELGQLAEKQRVTNERASDKMGKSSFSWAWGLDSLSEERERSVAVHVSRPHH